MTSRPVALSRDLPKNRVMRADVEGVDLAIWRNGKGEVAAWNNRCPHRGMRLSHGFVRGDNLACLYHGWQYDGSGRCRYIPAHPDLDPPETIRAETYEVAERDGVIWVSVAAPVEPVALRAGMEPLRSFTAFCGEDVLVDSVHRTPFKGEYAVGNPDGASGSFRVAGVDLAILRNPVAKGETLVHVLVAASVPLADRRALSRWCEAIRRHAEEPQETPA